MKYTTFAAFIIATLAGLGMSSIASGSVVVVTNRFVWDFYVGLQGATVATETFESFANGYQPSAVGTVGGTTWTATAPTNGLVTDGATVRTAAATDAIVFDFAPGVQGIGGNIYTSDLGQGKRFAFIEVTLADGVSYFGNSDNAEMFIGFYSDSAAIVKVTIITYQVPKQYSYATVDNLYFAFKEYDTDGDGILNSTDNCPTIANPSQADCNTNGIGDACESFTDCNTNTIPDSCDIASGASNDVDGNGIPDECKADCNSNELPDAWEISQGTVADCNANTIPDSCEVDSDADGTINACDGCPNDAAKIAPGACGCGVVDTDTDSDSDGTADCVDNDDDNDGAADSADAFPLNASESVDTDGDGIGNNADQDDDGDGADDASDGCPLDANKSAPGTCGCGNPDTDSDSDGVADCIDNCVAVANPTQDDCDGNGVGEACELFTDCNANNITDSCDIASGFAQDCNGNGKPDSCDIAAGNASPYPGAVQWTIASGGNGHWYARYGAGSTWENARTVALANGANLAAITSEAENTFIRDALMPPNGTWWIGGYQGSDLAWRWLGGDAWNFTSWDAGQPDGATEQRIVMSSNGTWFDAQSDEYGWIDSIFEWSATESDCNSNGVPDSCDIASGAAGDCNANSIPDSCEVDSDVDGTIDGCDGCPNDPAKIAAGTCGCGVAETDSDSDGTANCIDDDDDNDGVADYADAFPLDASESVDTDGDGQGNNADQDDDGDGADDASDGCPMDASKTAPGQCGCGVADTDGDGDGVVDCVDNCPNTSNSEQPDCDSDGVGDACDQDGPTTLIFDDFNDGVLDSSLWSVYLPFECSAVSENSGSLYSVGRGQLRSAQQFPMPGATVPLVLEFDWQDVGEAGELFAVVVRTASTPGFCCGGIGDGLFFTCYGGGVSISAGGGLTSADSASGAGIVSGGSWYRIRLEYTSTNFSARVMSKLDGTLLWQGSIAYTGQASGEGINIHSREFCETASRIDDIVLTSGVLSDCNSNGIPDSCEIASGAAGDCNANSIPDSCEVDSDADGTIDVCDGCPNDPAKIAAGACGCGVADTDTDSDGTANCFDDDDDNDGVADYADAFPLNASESVDTDGDGQGNNADQDDDNDGSDDASDGCPLDASKTAPGQCGCGVGDTDTDGDGVADCIDNCVSVPNPGQEDCNHDGTGEACELFADCNANGISDLCDIAVGFSQDCNANSIPDSCDVTGNNLTRLAQFSSESGSPYSYTEDGIVFTSAQEHIHLDGDRISNHNGCCTTPIIITAVEPTFTLKSVDVLASSGSSSVLVGSNGAVVVLWMYGTLEFGDSFKDVSWVRWEEYGGGSSLDNVTVTIGALPGLADCNSNGIPDSCEPDGDADGTIDACDGCPIDAGKTSAGACGCGIPDSDTDGDAIPDCVDNCPAVANPTQIDCNGNGIGEACESFTDCNANSIPDSCEADGDSDGTIDACDGCPNDPAKTAAGTCGCGVAETDSDSDGTANCIDDDDDNDGVADYADAFPLDASESVDTDGDGQGNNADQDDDNDGADDASDGCPFDTSKTSPGVCGCGNPDTDSDGDGIANCVDNCVAVANPSQDDCDGNGIGEACESFTDCNTNSIPDSCDISSGFAQDCNGNGEPDSCDIEQASTAHTARFTGVGGSPNAYTEDEITFTSGQEHIHLESGSHIRNHSTCCTTPILITASTPVFTLKSLDVLSTTSSWGTVLVGSNGASVTLSSPGSVDFGTTFQNVDWVRWEENQGDSEFDNITITIGQPGAADCNSNGIPDSCEIASGSVGDCDHDGTADGCEIAAGALDCNANGIPDACDVVSGGLIVDCNTNGIPDSCDITSGASMDCNANAIPDSCDIATGASRDVDVNGVPDECKPDCNNNDLPDAWEIAQGLVPDCNHNGIPDACENDWRDANTGNMGRFGNGVPATGTLSGMVTTTTAVTVRVEAVGDLGAATEYATLKLGQSVVGTLLFQTSGRDCPANPDVATLTLTKAQWNAIVASAGSSGDVEVTVSGSPLVDATQCGGAGMSYVSVTYGGPAYDCDGNGLSDLCEVGSGSGDCNNNAILDACELLSGSAPDIDTNGVIDSCQTDCNSNGLPDTYELTQGLVSDCNGNGIPDSCDLVNGAADCNGNGVIDSCDLSSSFALDCNGNSVPDSCDINSGISVDCNTNGVPDSCDIAINTAPDCNANGVPDSCDVATHTVPDCNTNGVPDSCDIASGASNDVDSNGIPDECKTDCNGNGLPDAWEISQGTVPDCNLNSIPDSCDLTSGAAADCNNNGVPDSCDITNGAIDKDANGQPDDCQYAHGDFDLSGDIGGGDLGFLLAVWGTNSVIGDLDGDHIIGGGDLGTLLSRWGPVQ